jgi:hypothetical protein
MGLPGIPGTSGATGSGGTSGTSGTGSPGSSGTSGVNGSSGTSGVNGSSGTSGVNGSSGTSGTSATVTINNNVDNYVMTGTGTLNTLNGEANLIFNGSTLTANSAISTGTITLTQVTGVAPMTVSSTTVVGNLNADLLDGQHGSYYLAYGNFTGTPTIGNATIQISPGTAMATGGSFTTNQVSNGTITLDHADTSTLSGAQGSTGIASITVDGLGHVTAVTTATYTGNTGTVTSVATGTGLTGGPITTTGTISLSTPVTVANGGTGASSFTAGYVLFGNGTSAIATDADLFWDSSANELGISTTSPTEKLHVEGGNIFINGESQGIIVDAGGNKRVGFMKYGGFEGAMVHGNAVPFRIGQVNQASVTGGTFTTQVSVDNSGNMVVLANITAYGSPSDERFKTNIHPLTGALEKVKQLQGVTFDWKEDTDSFKITNLKHDIGFIAQQVQEVLPDLVRADESGYLGLRERALIPLLVEAIKELSKKIEQLEQKQ